MSGIKKKLGKKQQKYPKKIMRVDAFFALPDNFKGTFSDALLMMVKHLRSMERAKDVKVYPVTKNFDLWNDFLQAVGRGDKSVIANSMASWKRGKYVLQKEKKNFQVVW